MKSGSGAGGGGGVQNGQNFPSGAFGAHRLLQAAPLATNCWPEAPWGGGGGLASWDPRSRPSLCDIPSGCCSFTGPWTVTRSSLRMLRRVAAFCQPLRPVLLLELFPRSQSPVVGVLGLCWMWHGVPFAWQRRPVVALPPLRRGVNPPSSFGCPPVSYIPRWWGGGGSLGMGGGGRVPPPMVVSRSNARVPLGGGGG